jgi:hypothetical protein
VLPSLDHVGDAHLEPAGSLPSRQLIRRKNPIPQILRIRLTATPRHDTLRHQPDTYESHPPASLNLEASVRSRDTDNGLLARRDLIEAGLN